ncbi:Dyp-type peroxidase family [Pedobacter cryoconitis]|uniref:Dyp-type peroxidase n=1 Tax=Pedobacter cryoconitis TaxID=188932 RepID=UPI00161B0184|nr:Dyp-type peroxidase [Pedobacter cryoconitis]MBB6269721.1 Dyp-type peroxidase family [Pedobacter cryoconitis]
MKTTLSLEERLDDVWKHCQRGLVYPSPHATFATFWLKTPDGKPIQKLLLTKLMAQFRKEINTRATLQSQNTTVVLGVSFKNWAAICGEENLPKGMKLNFPSKEDKYTSDVFGASKGAFDDSNGDIWFHIKSKNEAPCDEVLEMVVDALKDYTERYFAQKAASKSNREDGHKGKVLGCRFSENLNNPSDPVTIAKHTLIGGEDIDHLGGSFVLAQRFLINWNQINMMTEDQIEDLIGRKTDDTIIPDRDSRSHIKSARIQDENGNTTPVLRLGLPFGRAKQVESKFRVPKSVTLSDEEGIYFAGFCKEASILESIMSNQIGADRRYMNDRLFNHLKSDLGGLFYIPSIEDLELDKKPDYSNDFSAMEGGDWSIFPGVDWSRLDRHFQDSSENGLMYYNHQNYLFTMSTGIGRPGKSFFKVPSKRILSLLENIFSLWQDNWYFNRKQEEIKHDIRHYIDAYQGKDNPADIMKESIMIRKGWAIRLSLQLFSNADYGFRGRKIRKKDGSLHPYSTFLENEGECIYGSDTYRISPEEIIVGAMPNLSLGEGRYVMKYLSYAERMDGFLNNLSEASGVGHVIPHYEKALQKGLKEMKAEVLDYELKATTIEKKELYRSAYLSLEGISEYCINYEKLAREKAGEMAKGQAWERANLIAIADRMKKLSAEKPDTFVEAVQFIFTLHTCLHLNGEPTAIGRMDQLLQPFYEKDHISEDEAQEIIDAFYIKLDEKVQQNRIFMEDHQPFGNLAMGGSSGPYPQGASLGQWIQQITVGGTVANGAADFKDTKPAYNDITRLFIHASGRLPLNAPCLSLRTRKDMPENILEAAAHAVLSGGAHPILLNDEKIIQGLHESGDQVGGNLSQETKKWNSAVTIKSAQNYACDGCYEPQFPGENWFSLGGFSTLQPLECALNQGRTYSSAGQSYLFGQTVSLNSEPADQIKSFDELVTIYFQHFEILNRKAFNGQLRGYGANTKFCPSPLLNVLMDDCLAKGLDFYSGGTKYSIYGPCYISLSSAINSLYAIKIMVFDDKNAVTTLPELLECLCCDWGYKMTEPFISNLAGESRIAARSDRFKRLREIALSLPRYGRGHQEIDHFGNMIVERIARLSVETFTKPLPQMYDLLKDMAGRYGSEEFPFGLQIQPGVGTFENHVEMGAWNGASADGRRLGTAVASDLSAAPSPMDLPVDHQYAGFESSLEGFDGKGAELMTDGAPTDFNIDENFPVEKIISIMRQFAQGKSSNILTITVASPDTYTKAVNSPEQYNLLRVRTGGWSNFFTSVFPLTQEQHRRRPVSTPVTIQEEKDNAAAAVAAAAAKGGCPFHHKTAEK